MIVDFCMRLLMKDKTCRRVLDANQPATILAGEVRKCGYAHIGPGLFPASYVVQLAKAVRSWDSNSTMVHHSGADGGRINVVPPPKGPFAKDKPFDLPDRKLFETMQRALSPGECCHLFLYSVMIALPTSRPHVDRPTTGDQPWHRDQLRHFSTDSPWALGAWNHYYLYLYPHDVPEDLGPIELVPQSHPLGENDLTANDTQACESGGRGIGADAARRYSASPLAYHAPLLRAGSVLIHEASLAHRGLENRGQSARYAIRYDLFALGDKRAGGLVTDRANPYHGLPRVVQHTREYMMGMYRALKRLRLPLTPKLLRRQEQALGAPIVPFSSLTASHIYRKYAKPALWIAGARRALRPVKAALEAAVTRLERERGALLAVFLDEQDADARELYAMLGLWQGLGGLQFAGSAIGASGQRPIPKQTPRHHGPRYRGPHHPDPPHRILVHPVPPPA